MRLRVPDCDDYDHPALKACTHGAAALIQAGILVFQIRNMFFHLWHWWRARGA